MVDIAKLYLIVWLDVFPAEDIYSGLLILTYELIHLYFINKDCKRVGNNYPVFSHKFIHFREKLELILNEQSYLIFHGSDIYSLTKSGLLWLKTVLFYVLLFSL